MENRLPDGLGRRGYWVQMLGGDQYSGHRVAPQASVADLSAVLAAGIDFRVVPPGQGQGPIGSATASCTFATALVSTLHRAGVRLRASSTRHHSSGCRWREIWVARDGNGGSQAGRYSAG